MFSTQVTAAWGQRALAAAAARVAGDDVVLGTLERVRDFLAVAALEIGVPRVCVRSYYHGVPPAGRARSAAARGAWPRATRDFLNATLAHDAAFHALAADLLRRRVAAWGDRFAPARDCAPARAAAAPPACLNGAAGAPP